ncbi:MAG: two-component regulator propeller domain-containing protein [Candidatus Latescibacter sp.]|nr:two-component regulator propeller domain-containing protein [Candidatus Latescibacter sp.]
MPYRAFVLCMIALACFSGVSHGQGKWTNYTDWSGIYAVAVEGNYIWAGTHRGVVRWDMETGTFMRFTSVESLVEKRVLSIAMDRQGALWFGTYEGAVSKFDGITWKLYTTANGPAGVYVSSIAVDNQGALWFATVGGASKFDGSSWKTYTTADGLVSNGVSSIAVDNRGTLWFGTYGFGVSKFDGVSWKTYTTSDGLVSNDLIVINADNQGSLWFGTLGGGVSKFDGVSWKTYTTADGLAGNKVYSIAVDKQGAIWFGTNGGVSKFDGSMWKTYTTADGLVDNGVSSIAVDNKGALWFGTNGGVSKFEEQSTLVSDSQSMNRPESFGIRAAYPNPFNPSTTIDFTLSNSGKTKLSIYNISGRLVDNLVDEVMRAGTHRVVWNASSRATGVYFVMLELGGKRDVRKVLFMK